MPKDHVKLFDTISPVYAWFFNSQVAYYRKVINILKQHVPLENYKRVLDVGCGTGPLCYVLKKAGFDTYGVEVSKGMLDQALKRLKGMDIKAYKIEPGERFPFDDNFFDIAIASYVAHGIKKEEREILYKEMSRVARDYVILHDYHRNRDFLTSFVEWLEGGDYFNFVEQVEEELRKNFEGVKVVELSKRVSLYILKPYKDLN
ncbi:SAM-dependent methyltransferase [Caldanaerobacter subterraneus subsp. yonseiensis KB-1]|uniref:SAM-dependent methyltransferase n=1 Tax=Caldanaerobacter subterraneus subsp. yonseiensis KB-1 TaxID=1388761 RepID=U5CXK1_CALSX|nr:class I SAM-dependent methyltransferase [Caldanaerobacter subterraneus]ERM92747.1 SAM-dependent methyltransferase [Caldanaerobacter subterraneus subsp. yonseiensis KB-1]